MHIVSTTRIAVKRSREGGQTEDAHWPRTSVNLFTPVFRAAVGDGASGSFCTPPWAQLITRGYCQNAFADHHRKRRLTRMRQHWEAIARPTSDAWYVRDAYLAGTATALVGITIRDPNIFEETGRFSALAVGDCALYQVRGNQLITAWPYQHSSTFRNRPYQITSRGQRNRDLDEHIQRIEGWWHSGDQFLLMSDAIAEWFIREHETGRWPWQQIQQLERQGRSPRFAEWINDLRDRREMADDDVTLTHIVVYEERTVR